MGTWGDEHVANGDGEDEDEGGFGINDPTENEDLHGRRMA